MFLKPCDTLAMSGVENNSVLNLHIPGCGGGKG